MVRLGLAFLWLFASLAAPASATEAAAAQGRETEPRRVLTELVPQAPDRPLVITPWRVSDPDAHVLRYFPGLTFKQGQAPIRGPGETPWVPADGGMAVGVGLEGRAGTTHGWQVLANFAPSPFTPVFDPRFSLHGYMLPQPQWGLDGDVTTDMRGTLSAELGGSWLLTEPNSAIKQVRLALGRRALGSFDAGGYGYGQLTLWRDYAPLGLNGTMSLFSSLGGGWRGSVDGQQVSEFSRSLRLRTDASVGTSGSTLPTGDRLGLGLLSHDWMTAGTRVSGRMTLLTPLVQGLKIGMGPMATLRQIEGAFYAEAGQLFAADLLSNDGIRGGAGLEVVLVQDTVLGFPLAVSLGYAVPVWQPDGLMAPWPGRFYISTTGANFSLIDHNPTPSK